MNEIKLNECVAQGAATWSEREDHEAIMKMISQIDVQVETHITTDEEHAMMSDLPSSWTDYHFVGPTVDKLVGVVNRGNSEEILYMIEKHMQVLRSYPTLRYGYLPDKVQEALVKRNNKDEINAIIKHYGFCESAQLVLLQYWPIEEALWYINFHGFATAGQRYIMGYWSSNNVMTYLNRHGLSVEGQVALISRGVHEEIELYLQLNNFVGDAVTALIKRGNTDEIIQYIMKKNGALSHDDEKLLFEHNVMDETHLYIKFYSIDEQLVLEMFDKFDQDGKDEELMFYICHHELSLLAQKRLINTSNANHLFKEYVSRYAFAQSLHQELVVKRDYNEVRFYIDVHPELEDTAEDLFFMKASSDDKWYYVRNRKRNDNHVLTSLLKLRPVDYELLTEAFLKCQRNLSRDKVVTEASREGVLEIISKAGNLSEAEVVALFFRNDAELFENYINTHNVVFK
jgi:hypothetical protein